MCYDENVLVEFCVRTEDHDYLRWVSGYEVNGNSMTVLFSDTQVPISYRMYKILEWPVRAIFAGTKYVAYFYKHEEV